MTKRNFLTPAQLMAMPEPAWLVESLVVANSLVVLFGPPKIGKSFLALDWAACIATALRWLTYAVADHRRPIVYVAGEGVGGIGKRLRAWQEARGNGLGAAPLLFPDRVPNLFSNVETVLFAKDIEDLHLAVPPCLIVVDTLSRVMIGADENDAGDVNVTIANLDYLRNRFGCTVLVLHHTTKSNEHVERGSTALRGAADVMLRLEHNGIGSLSLVVDAARDFESGKEIVLRIQEAGDSCVMTQTQTPEGGALDPLALDLLRILAGALDFGAEAATTKAWLDGSQLKKPTFYRLMNALLAKGLIENVGPQKARMHKVSADGYRVLEETFKQEEI